MLSAGVRIGRYNQILFLATKTWAAIDPFLPTELGQRVHFHQVGSARKQLGHLRGTRDAAQVCLAR